MLCDTSIAIASSRRPCSKLPAQPATCISDTAERRTSPSPGRSIPSQTRSSSAGFWAYAELDESASARASAAVRVPMDRESRLRRAGPPSG